MIKVLINNEEVVFNKEVTINEETLATSSVILNGVYPKLWEEDRDYVSRFYLPKDYSRCEFYDENPKNVRILGETKQTGNPTPENPSQIDVLTGSIKYQFNNKTYDIDLGDLELCKIGNSQDFIFYQNGKWFVSKECDSIKLKIADMNNYEENPGWTGLSELANLKKYFPNENKDLYDVTSFICNISPYESIYIDLNTVYDSTLYFYIYDGHFMLTQAEWKEKFPDLVVEIYYSTGNTEVTEITDQALIEQLNKIGTDLIFAGVVKNTGNISLNPREPKYCSLQVLDFKTLLSEGTTLDFVIADKTIREAIELVTNAISSYGFVVGNIMLDSADDIIGAYSTLDKSSYDVYQYISEITLSKWFTRRIDEKTVAIDFYDVDKLPRANDIEYTEAYWKQNNIIDMTYSFSTADYRNKQVITSSETYANIETNEQLISNGYQTEFTVQQKLGTVNSIVVNGETKTVITNDEKDIGLTADFYYTSGETKFTSAETYSAGTEIEIGYTAIIQGREIVYNTAEIQRLNNQLGINGTISRYENRNDVLYSKQLQSIAQNYLKYKGQAEITLKIETKNSNLFFVGQQAYFHGPAELPDLTGDYMVKKKTTKFYLVNDVIYAFYTFELTNSYNAETAINFFDNQRAKANGNISQGEYVSRNVDVENTANIIFSNLQITELTIDGDNTLEAGLEMPLVG